MSEQHGIDVAWPQGARYNWGQWAGRIQFGMCKATESTDLIDVGFENNWDSMWWVRPDHRLPRFAYHFLRPAENPTAQARHFVSTVKTRGLLPGDNLVMDLEVNDDLPSPVVAERGVEFLHEVNALAPGHRVLVYTYPAFAEAGNCAGMESWYLWIANYGVSRPVVPAPWQTWTFWQCGDTVVDTDVFNGSEDALLAFTRMPDKR